MAEFTVFVLGLVVGSFANATVGRIQARPATPAFTSRLMREGGGERGTRARRSIWLSRSACPRCGHALAVVDLVPVVSWVVLRGNCRYCGQPISIRYPLSELLTAVAFTLVFCAVT